jgi:chromosomal replication initiation ATPase DnaA
MGEGARQLVLDLPLEPRFGEEDFLVSASNALAHGAVTRWPDWPTSFLHLEGPPGSGKSHLASIWAERAGAPRRHARSVAADQVPDLTAGRALALEDLDRGPLQEAALFHLVNLARERGLSVLFTSAAAIERCGIGTPDLSSRLRLAHSVRLGPPDDALVRAVLVKLFADRQLAVDAGVVEYVATRIERSLERAVAVVADLDREALSRGRRITRFIAADVLARGAEGGDDADSPS